MKHVHDDDDDDSYRGTTGEPTFWKMLGLLRHSKYATTERRWMPNESCRL